LSEILKENDMDLNWLYFDVSGLSKYKSNDVKIVEW
jgi:hypothetical protein